MKWSYLTDKKEQLDTIGPLPDDLAQNLEDWFRVELTYTSNALEGNTLTRRETALVLEKGIAVGGKLLIEHLEATNHAGALDWIAGRVSRNPANVVERDILQLHNLVLKGIDDANAGHYRSVPVRIAGSPVVMPNPRKVPDLMESFTSWLRLESGLHPVQFAAEAHFQLVAIHPFIDGNGRTARLLMNLLLQMSGYPPAIIRKRDRTAYIRSLEQAHMGGSKEDFDRMIAHATERSLDIYLKAARGEDTEMEPEPKLLNIRELAK